MQLNYVQHPRPRFNGNISVADCMPLSSLLNTIKINGGSNAGGVWKQQAQISLKNRATLFC